MSAEPSQSTDTGSIVRDNVGPAVLAGVGAYVVGYVLTYVFAAIDGVEVGEAPAWKVVGIVFYEAHNAQTQATFSLAGSRRTESVAVIANADGLGSTVPELLYYLVPVVVLVGAGYLLYARAGRSLPTGTAAALGASVVAGYAVPAVAGVFLFEYTESTEFLVSASASIAPAPGTAVLLVAVLYPLVFGAIGGVVGQATG